MTGATFTESRGPWLVSAGWDVAVFGGSAALAFALLAIGSLTSASDRTLPVWTWLATVVFVDVAHVWATAYRVYLDPEERGRRPGLYVGIPVAAYVAGVLLYSVSAGLFWRVLAYVAVVHFVRQQYGWVALYRRRLGVWSRLDRWVDDAAIYSATLYPLLYWHAHLPREFECRGRPAVARPPRNHDHLRDEAGLPSGTRPAGEPRQDPDRGDHLAELARGDRGPRLGLRLHGDERARARDPLPGVRLEIRPRALP
jgi:hypothetical protein